MKMGAAAVVAKDYPLAAQCYERAMNLGRAGGGASTRRARAALVTVYRSHLRADLAKIPDGSYKGVARGYVGKVAVAVDVKDHQIVAIRVEKQQESQPLTACETIPSRIVEKQGVAKVDAVTGATVTSNAVMIAVSKALLAAERKAARPSDKKEASHE